MQNISQKSSNPTLALIIIGNEILSGRTLDKNTQYIAEKTAKFGISLKEVRVIPDDEGEIVTTVNELRKKFDYVLTTGGIGPTHDDITTDCIAKAFGVEVWRDPVAYSLLVDYYGGEENLNPGRIKMSNVPKTSDLILNPVSAAPGFAIGNVYCMAGVPKIMQAMLDNVIPLLKHGKEVVSKTVKVIIQESKIAALLTEIQGRYAEVEIGSYPYMVSDGFGDAGTNIVFRSINAEKIDSAVVELVKALDEVKISYEVL